MGKCFDVLKAIGEQTNANVMESDVALSELVRLFR